MLIGRAADGSNMNINAALDATKVTQNQQENAQQKDSPAYQVNLSGAAESYKTHWQESGRDAYLTTRAGQSQEDELAEMMAAIEDVTKQREQNKKPWSWTPNCDLSRIDPGIETVQLKPSSMGDAPEIVRMISEMTRSSLPNLKLVVPEDLAFRYPNSIDTIKSQHYTWTAKNGLVENTATAEGAARVAETEDRLKNTMKQEISDTISDILKPYSSYSEANEELKDKNVFVNSYAHAGDSVLSHTKQISGGLFGKLASQLNDYAKNFGSDDKFLDDIKTAIGVLTGDDEEKNPLLKQVESMVRYVQGGGELDVKDKKFEKAVANAIDKVYKHKDGAKNVELDKKDTGKSTFKTDTSYLDNVRQQLEQTSEILDKMTDAGDNKGKHKIKTVRDVLDSRAPGDSFDMDFHQRLAHVGDKNAPATNTADKIFGRKKPIDATSADDADNLAALQAGWNEYIESHNLIDSSKVSTLF